MGKELPMGQGLSFTFLLSQILANSCSVFTLGGRNTEIEL